MNMQMLPMMIVKGHSSSSREKSKTVATQLAKHLKYFPIDQDDFVPSDSSSPTDLNNLFSFKILHQLASTQLSLGLGVVINLSPHSDETHMDRLKRLSKTHKAELILIRCQPLDTPQIDDFDKFAVDSDTSSVFDVKSYVSEKLALAFPQAADFQPKNDQKPSKVVAIKANLGKTSSFRPSREKVPVPVPPQIFKHLHELASPLTKSTTEKLPVFPCKSCKEPISVSDPSYQCLESNCKDYVFHKACAESPGLEDARKNCPEYLRQVRPEYRFEKEKVYCLLQTIINGKLLPLVVNHESHAHPLNLIIVPISFNYEFGCCGCGDLGKSISYRCFDCNFNLHVRCVLLERAFKKDTKQTVRLNYGSLEENCWEKSNCDVCNTEISPEQWFYYNSATESTSHIRCLNPASG
ncbi:C1-like protein [Corchorus olitorius]|uniref:C1-like protein n=1 Tax=Corchorus olitorius TaxID=93759 RepID=A0A1R3JVY3_9ROSI|nr:C1-like protein [Corchorus olitorius]